MSQIDFDVIGEDIAARHFFEMSQRMADPRPAFRKVRDLITRGDAKNFQTHGSYFGNTWPPLSQATLARKGSGELGVASGRLKTAVMGGSGRKTSVTRKQVTVGVGKKVFYAKFFAGGTTRSAKGGSDQPPRPIVGMTEGQQNTANFILRRYITQGHVI